MVFMHLKLISRGVTGNNVMHDQQRRRETVSLNSYCIISVDELPIHVGIRLRICKQLELWILGVNPISSMLFVNN